MSHSEILEISPDKKLPENTNLLPLTMRERNMINPFKQHAFTIGIFKNKDSKRFDWNNRLTIVFTPNQADRYHDNWLEQLDLFQGEIHDRLQKLNNLSYDKTEFYIQLEHSIRKTVLPLLRSAVSLFIKKQKEKQMLHLKYKILKNRYNNFCLY